MVSTQQQTAAGNIQHVFLQKKIRYAILKSQCQSGKTGAFQELIRLMLRDNQISHAYILCGSTELELRSQAIADTQAHNPEAYASGKIKVLFRQDFASAELDVSRALFVVDESHLDQTQGQQLDQLLSRYGLSADGNPGPLAAKNSFFVSVDATPYAELAALAHKETPYEKHVEDLRPGENYVGLGDYLYLGLLRPTFALSEEPRRFVEMFSASSPKYALVRLSAGRKGKNAQEVALENICSTFGYKLLPYTAASTDVAITRAEQQRILKEEGCSVPCLEDAPTVNTVVLIRGRLRAGKVVPKKHIAFVWEGAVSCKTDALVQGLPGRMCGYAQLADEPENPMKLDTDNYPVLFAPPSSLERKETKVVKSSEIERAILAPDVLPTKATNLKKPRVDSRPSNGRSACVPLCLTRSVADADAYDEAEDGSVKKVSVEILLAELKAQLKSKVVSDSYTAEQQAEITAMIDAKNIRGRWIRAANAPSHKQALEHVITAHRTQTAAPNHVVSQHDGITFFIISKDLRGVADARPQDVYAVFYTKASAGVKWIQTAHLQSRIPETNGRSIFSFSDRATVVPLVAAGATGFSETNLKTPQDLEAALRSYLTHWRTSDLTVTREITSASDRFALDKTKFHYKDAKTNDVQRLCEKLGTEFEIKMKIKYARSSAGRTGHFNVKSIAW